MISPKEPFSVLFSVPQNLIKSLSFRLLSTAEAIAIRHFNPELCKQKHLFALFYFIFNFIFQLINFSLLINYFVISLYYIA